MAAPAWPAALYRAEDIRDRASVSALPGYDRCRQIAPITSSSPPQTVADVRYSQDSFLQSSAGNQPPSCSRSLRTYFRDTDMN
jgi:hypothetical protein